MPELKDKSVTWIWYLSFEHDVNNFVKLEWLKKKYRMDKLYIKYSCELIKGIGFEHDVNNFVN